MDKININSINFLSATKTADYTITNIDLLSIVFVNPSARAISITLPSASANTDRNIRIKVTTKGGNVTIVGTIDGNTNLFLNRKDDFVDLTSNGTSWLINHCLCSYSTGWINTDDWSNRHLGSMEITYNTKVGSFILGELITESTSGNTWVITADSGTWFTCKEATGTGHATNGRTLTGTTSGATCNVNGSSKNVDSYISHNLGKNVQELIVCNFWSTDSTENNSVNINDQNAYYSGALVSSGLTLYQISTNQFKHQGGDYYAGTYADENGNFGSLNTQNYYYKTLVSYIK